MLSLSLLALTSCTRPGTIHTPAWKDRLPPASRRANPAHPPIHRHVARCMSRPAAITPFLHPYNTPLFTHTAHTHPFSTHTIHTHPLTYTPPHRARQQSHAATRRARLRRVICPLRRLGARERQRHAPREWAVRDHGGRQSRGQLPAEGYLVPRHGHPRQVRRCVALE